MIPIFSPREDIADNKVTDMYVQGAGYSCQYLRIGDVLYQAP